MTTPTAITLSTDRWDSLRGTAPALLLGLVLLGLIFRQEVAAAVGVWSTSTAYNHCFLVVPIAAWLAYDRRRWLPSVPARPQPWITVGALPIAAAWLLAERLGIMEGRQLMAIALVELLFLAVLGWRLTWLLAAPLLYLVFLVPFGSFLTPSLQHFTAGFIVRGLNVLGIVNISDGNTIEIPEGTFFVAEACAGLRFLIASISFGVLYAVTFYRSPGRRAAFIVASIVVPVIANGIRALGIVAAGHWVGSAEAAAADHLIYGWLFFSAVTLLLIVAGLPFRQDDQTTHAPVRSADGGPPRTFAVVLPALLLAIFAAAGPLFAGELDREAASTPVAPPSTITSCTPLDAADHRNRVLPSLNGVVIKTFSCENDSLTMTVATFPPRSNPNAILALQRAADGQGEAEDAEFASVPNAAGWQFVTTTQPGQTLATALWLDGQPASGGLRSRLQQARNSVLGLNHPPVLAIIRATAAGSLLQQRAAITNYFGDPAHSGADMSATLAAFSATPASNLARAR